MEECAECIQAAHKVLRKDDVASWLSLAEEMADVQIMIEQIASQTDWHWTEKRIKEAKEEKLLRLKKTIEEWE